MKMIAHPKRLLKVKQKRLAILNILRVLDQSLLLHPIHRLLLAPRANAAIQLQPRRRTARRQMGSRDFWRFHVATVARSKTHQTKL